MATGFLYDERFLHHDAGPGHPERKERLESTIVHLRARPWYDQLVPLSPTAGDPSWIETVHSAKLIGRAAAACESGLPFLDVADVGISSASYEVACLAVGGALQLADRVASGELDNAFSLSRPPGHHAEHDRALGFCLFNNVAITARYLQREHGLDKVAILDWDVHHGNGTQHTFDADPSVLYLSLHQYPYYPGTGAASENGEGAGRGATVNCPMPAGASDDLYRSAFAERILPALDAFAPQAVIISAGFDAHVDDPLAQVCLSTECFGWMTERVMEIANQHAGGRIISMLEGGYNTETLPHCIATHLQVLLGVP